MIGGRQKQAWFQERLTEAVIDLCRQGNICYARAKVEGTICVVCDENDIIVAHITESFFGNLRAEAQRQIPTRPYETIPGVEARSWEAAQGHSRSPDGRGISERSDLLTSSTETGLISEKKKHSLHVSSKYGPSGQISVIGEDGSGISCHKSVLCRELLPPASHEQLVYNSELQQPRLEIRQPVPLEREGQTSREGGLRAMTTFPSHTQLTTVYPLVGNQRVPTPDISQSFQRRSPEESNQKRIKIFSEAQKEGASGTEVENLSLGGAPMSNSGCQGIPPLSTYRFVNRERFSPVYGINANPKNLHCRSNSNGVPIMHKCPYCENTFPTSAKLWKHIRNEKCEAKTSIHDEVFINNEHIHAMDKIDNFDQDIAMENLDLSLKEKSKEFNDGQSKVLSFSRDVLQVEDVKYDKHAKEEPDDITETLKEPNAGDDRRDMQYMNRGGENLKDEVTEAAVKQGACEAPLNQVHSKMNKASHQEGSTRRKHLGFVSRRLHHTIGKSQHHLLKHRRELLSLKVHRDRKSSGIVGVKIMSHE